MSVRACASATASTRASPPVGAGIPNADPALRVAFFALAWDQDLNAPIKVFARDVAGNEATAGFEYKVFPKPFRNSKIDLPDSFLQRVVPAILSNTPSLKVDNPDDVLASFLVINRDLRRENNATIKSLASKTNPKMLWQGTFAQLGNSQVEASFADKRTYFYKGQEVDRQVHLGFDLAVTSNVAVQPANCGRRAVRQLAGHLRQLRDRGPRARRAVAVRAPRRPSR